jgi:hypothetical protein
MPRARISPEALFLILIFVKQKMISELTLTVPKNAKKNIV